jgi:Na+/phosphate symporter
MGKASCADIARRYDNLNISNDDVHNHIYYHNKDIKSAEGIGMEHIYEKVSNIVTRLERYFNLLTVNEETIDEKTIKMLTSLSKELRESLKMAVDLEDKWGDKRNEKETKKIKEKYDKIKNVLMEETCEDCKDRIFKRLKIDEIL